MREGANLELLASLRRMALLPGLSSNEHGEPLPSRAREIATCASRARFFAFEVTPAPPDNGHLAPSRTPWQDHVLHRPLGKKT